MSDGFVYFIRAEGTGSIKIGFSTNHPSIRLKELQTGSPSKLELLTFYEGSQKDENKLHHEFAEDRGNGEWFEESPRLKERIKELLEKSLEKKKEGIDVLNLNNSSTENENEYEVVTVNFDNGEKYVGQVKDNLPHGQGKFTYADTDELKDYVYEGEWKDGVKHGQGKMSYITSNGLIIFEGEFKDGALNGKGSWSLLGTADPTQWFNVEGEFKDGKIHGQGCKTYTGQHGDKFTEEGEFMDGELFNGTIRDDKTGEVFSKLINGKRKNKRSGLIGYLQDW